MSMPRYKTPEELINDSKIKLEKLKFEYFDDSKDGTVYLVPDKPTMDWFLVIPKDEYASLFLNKEIILGTEIQEKYQTG